MFRLFSSVDYNPVSETVTLPRPLSGQDAETIDVTCPSYKVRPNTAYGTVGFAEPKKAYIQCQHQEIPEVLGFFVGTVEGVREFGKLAIIKVNCHQGFVDVKVWADSIEKEGVEEGVVLSGFGSVVFREYNGKLSTTFDLPDFTVEKDLHYGDAPVTSKKQEAPTARRRTRTSPAPSQPDFDDIPL